MKPLSALVVTMLAVWLVAGAVHCSEPSQADTDPRDEWLSSDKLLHLLASAYLVGFSYRAYHDGFSNPPDNSRVFAVSLTGVAGAGKELYDMRSGGGTASWKDVAADALGIALGIALFTYLD